jgi:hypothetical protein
MHVSKAELPAMVFGDYQGRTVDAAGYRTTMGTVARNLGLVAS